VGVVALHNTAVTSTIARRQQPLLPTKIGERSGIERPPIPC